MAKEIGMVLALMLTGCMAAGAQSNDSLLQKSFDNCRSINGLIAQGYLRKISNELLAQGYCSYLNGTARFHAAGSPGRLECTSVSQAFAREMINRGMPIVGLC